MLPTGCCSTPTARPLRRAASTASWPAGSTYRLGSRNPTDNTTWGFARVALATPVAPGETANIVIKARAPAVPGTYDFQWRPIQEGIEYFGELTDSIAISVTPPLFAASFVSQTVPNPLLPGRTYNASIVMQNTGAGPWNPLHGVVSSKAFTGLCNDGIIAPIVLINQVRL